MSFVFSSKLAEQEVLIDEVSYTLREATAEVARQYRNKTVSCTRFQGGAVSGIQGIGDIETFLVSLCLFDSSNKSVPEPVVKGWTARIIRSLYDWIREVSGLEEKTSEVPDTLKQVLESPDSPVSWQALKEFVLHASDSKELKKLFEVKDDPKNS